MPERIQKIIANAGLCSRREAEELIKAGKVKVNDKIATIGMSAEPANDRIEVDGKVINRRRHEYYLLHKPVKYLTTLSDPSGKKTIAEFLPRKARLLPVGRLDYLTEGALLITSDGDFLNKVAHPRYEVSKLYRVFLAHSIQNSQLNLINKGIVIEGRKVEAKARSIARDGKIVDITIHEGRNRIIRKMMDEIGMPVLKLMRLSIGPVELANLPPGKMRKLTPSEITYFQEKNAQFKQIAVEEPSPEQRAFKSRREMEREVRREFDQPSFSREERLRHIERPERRATTSREQDKPRSERTFEERPSFKPRHKGSNFSSHFERSSREKTTREGSSPYRKPYVSHQDNDERTTRPRKSRFTPYSKRNEDKPYVPASQRENKDSGFMKQRSEGYPTSERFDKDKKPYSRDNQGAGFSTRRDEPRSYIRRDDVQQAQNRTYRNSPRHEEASTFEEYKARGPHRRSASPKAQEHPRREGQRQPRSKESYSQAQRTYDRQNNSRCPRLYSNRSNQKEESITFEEYSARKKKRR